MFSLCLNPTTDWHLKAQAYAHHQLPSPLLHAWLSRATDARAHFSPRLLSLPSEKCHFGAAHDQAPLAERKVRGEDFQSCVSGCLSKNPHAVRIVSGLSSYSKIFAPMLQRDFQSYPRCPTSFKTRPFHPLANLFHLLASPCFHPSRYHSLF